VNGDWEWKRAGRGRAEQGSTCDGGRGREGYLTVKKSHSKYLLSQGNGGAVVKPQRAGCDSCNTCKFNTTKCGIVLKSKTLHPKLRKPGPRFSDPSGGVPEVKGFFFLLFFHFSGGIKVFLLSFFLTM
jgi:hypothetical protein